MLEISEKRQKRVFHRNCGKPDESRVFNRYKLKINKQLLPLCIKNVHPVPPRRTRCYSVREDRGRTIPAKSCKITSFRFVKLRFSKCRTSKLGTRTGAGGHGLAFHICGIAGSSLQTEFSVQISLFRNSPRQQFL